MHKLICENKLQQSRISVSKNRKTQDEMGFRFSAKTSFNPAIFYMLHVHNNTINKVQETISENKQESRDSGTKLHKSKIILKTQQATYFTN